MSTPSALCIQYSELQNNFCLEACKTRSSLNLVITSLHYHRYAGSTRWRALPGLRSDLTAGVERIIFQVTYPQVSALLPRALYCTGQIASPTPSQYRAGHIVGNYEMLSNNSFLPRKTGRFCIIILKHYLKFSLAIRTGLR